MGTYIIFFVATCVLAVLGESVVVNVFQKVRRDVNDECKHPPPPDRITEVCCTIPTISGLEDAIEQCHEQIHKHPPPNAGSSAIKTKTHLFRRFAENSGPEHPHPPPFSNERRNCIVECMFNTLGLLTSDGQLNEEIMKQKIDEEVAKNPKWSSVAPTTHKKCIAVAKESNIQSAQGCKPGPAEYAKCLGRETFFNCPTDLWNNSTECNDMKGRMERCPNMPPPPPPMPNHPPPRP